MSKCIILGAGASYGYDESLSELQRPPLTNQIFSRGLKLGLLDKQDYPNLLSKLGYYSELTKSAEVGNNIDVEQFLSWVAEQSETLARSNSQSPTSELFGANMKEALLYKTAIGELWYFLFDIIRHYSVSYKPTFDAYQRLALHSYDCFYNVINLNYDTIFESAIMYSGLSHNYFPPNNPRMIPIAKVHGSVNWLRASRENRVREDVACSLRHHSSRF